MNGKRFENRLNKSNIKFNTLNPVWDNEKGTALNVFEMIDKLNEYSEKTYELELRIDELEDDNQRYSLGTGKPVLENPQFKVTGCPYEILDTMIKIFEDSGLDYCIPDELEPVIN